MSPDTNVWLANLAASVVVLAITTVTTAVVRGFRRVRADMSNVVGQLQNLNDTMHRELQQLNVRLTILETQYEADRRRNDEKHLENKGELERMRKALERGNGGR